MRLALAVLLFVAGFVAPLAALELEGEFVQGGMVIGRVAPGSEVRLGDKPVRVSNAGVFVIGFGRDHGPDAVLDVYEPDGTFERRFLQIVARDYEVQRIDGLPSKMVTPPDEVVERIRRENAEIARVRALDTAEALFDAPWRWPVVGTVTGVFGSQRILNGEPRRPHYGIDIAAPAGTPVVAPTDAIVRMAAPDLYFTGGTVMLDHGHGVTSVYSHLASTMVAPGQRVKAGQTIGTVGASGRATGAHLDWRINWFAERLDPALIAGPMPSG